MTAQATLVGSSPRELFDAALRGATCTVLVHGGRPRPLPVRRWSGVADLSDRVVLAHCVGSTIDLGCGPGRMAEELARTGRTVLAVDMAAEAVARARGRGVEAVQRDIFGPLPREGRWDTALLADGNIGIGGDPARLLARVRGLLSPGGRVVVDLAPPGTGLLRHTVSLSVRGRRSHPFPWAVLGTDSLAPVAVEADLSVSGVHEWSGRWFAFLHRDAGRLSCRG